MYIPDYYEFGCRVNMVTGHHALENIPELLFGMGAKNPMLLTDKGVRAAGLVDIVMDAMGDNLAVKTIEDEVPPDSALEVVNRLAIIYRKLGCDAIIAVGGGSVLDTAKGINILVSEKAEDLMAFTGSGALKRKLNPLIAVPTTAGTGSEVTIGAVISDPENNRKMLFGSYFLLPDTAVIDSRMTLTLLTPDARSRLHLYLVREAISGNDSLKERFQHTYCQWFGLVDKAYQKMPDSQTKIPVKSKFLVAVVDGFILQGLLGTEPTPVKEIVALMLKTIEP
jgi:Iron-containing alcohol dehydrogenase